MSRGDFFYFQSYLYLQLYLNFLLILLNQASHQLFEKLFILAEVIEEGDSYQAKKNLEQVEQSLFDSVKQNDTEKVSTNVNKLKEKIESLLDLENHQNTNNNFSNLNSENIKDEIEELAQQIEDLLKTGTKEGVDEKIQKLKKLKLIQ